MKYDISNKTAPKMPTLGNGTECIHIILSQASKTIPFPLFLMLSSLLGTHVGVFKFLHHILIWWYFDAKWQTRWPIPAATRANCPISSRPYVTNFASTTRRSWRNSLSGNEEVGGCLLLVVKATVCSLADEQTTAAERRMNGEKVVFRRRI